MFGLGIYGYLIIIIPIVSAVTAWVVAKNKNRNCFVWALLSFFFPALLLILLMLSADE